MKNKKQSQNNNYKIKLPKLWMSFKNKALIFLNMQGKTGVILYISYPQKYHENLLLSKNKIFLQTTYSKAILFQFTFSYFFTSHCLCPSKLFPILESQSFLNGNTLLNFVNLKIQDNSGNVNVNLRRGNTFLNTAGLGYSPEYKNIPILCHNGKQYKGYTF